MSNLGWQEWLHVKNTDSDITPGGFQVELYLPT